MRDLLDAALDTAVQQGAGYADVRMARVERESILTKNGRVAATRSNDQIDLGVRVIVNGCWGFAASSDVSVDEAKRIAAEAVAVARASGRAGGDPVILAPSETIETDWATPVTQDPFAVPFDEKVKLLLACDAAMRKEKAVRVAEGAVNLMRRTQQYADTQGSVIDQTIVHTGIGISCIAVGEGEHQVRSFPNSFRGQHLACGWEMVGELDLEANAPRIAAEAAALLTAPPCPAGETTVILDSNQLALQIHESCGHPIELDRAFGMEANFAGTSFLTADKLDRLRYGSEIVNLVADATQETCPRGLGTFGYDDEGVPAQRTDIVKDGIFTGYLSSRETAPRIGRTSSGTMRADTAARIPLIRMTNINLLPGNSSIEGMIEGTKDGILMNTNRSWSIDDKRLNFQFGTEIGWEIKNGKRGRMLKNPTYAGSTPVFWGACDAIGGPDEWILWGTPNCGKGEPSQIMPVGHGTAPARFRNVKVGVAGNGR